MIKENERIDDLQLKGLKIIQNKDGFCFGIDAVLLANYVKPKSKATMVDLCTGTGIIPIIVSAKSNIKKFIGVEIQKEVSDMAKRSVKMNSLEDKIEILNKDLKDLKSEIGNDTAHIVTVNPPYMTMNKLISCEDKKAISRNEVFCTIEDIIKEASRILVSSGKLFMIHRPTRLADILGICRNFNMELKELQFIHPRKQKAPNLMLMTFVKKAKPELKILDPIYVYEEDGVTKTKQIEEIYKIQELECE